MNPKLRAIDIRPFVHQGEPSLLLRDPLGLSGNIVVLPQFLGPVLGLCDGTRDEAGVAAAANSFFMLNAGVRLPPEIVSHVIQTLDENLFLENERYRAAYEATLQDFRSAPYREPGSAGVSYHDEPGALRAMLRGYVDGLPDGRGPGPGWKGRGIISPHIDFARGGAVYAALWTAASESLRRADLVVIFGTDHMGNPGSITLTRQSYKTPLGVLPTDEAVVNAVAAAMGEESAFEEELHHRSEHSIELAAVWLKYVLGEKEVPVVPVLCGSFGHFVVGGVAPSADHRINAAVEALREATVGMQIAVVAAADLAHVGPAFGDPPVDVEGRARLKRVDDELIDAMCSGDAEGFFSINKREKDRWKVCGIPPIYMTLRLLGETKGQLTGYELCPADEDAASFVSICGILLD